MINGGVTFALLEHIFFLCSKGGDVSGERIKLTMRSSGLRGQLIVFPDVFSARSRLMWRYVLPGVIKPHYLHRNNLMDCLS